MHEGSTPSMAAAARLALGEGPITIAGSTSFSRRWCWRRACGASRASWRRSRRAGPSSAVIRVKTVVSTRGAHEASSRRSSGHGAELARSCRSVPAAASRTSGSPEDCRRGSSMFVHVSRCWRNVLWSACSTLARSSAAPARQGSRWLLRTSVAMRAHQVDEPLPFGCLTAVATRWGRQRSSSSRQGTARSSLNARASMHVGLGRRRSRKRRDVSHPGFFSELPATSTPRV
eukprot:scaffold17439_cov43-Phaeocystis_antarctica.AAC.4